MAESGSWAELAAHFAELAKAMSDDGGRSIDSDRLLRVAVGAVPGAEHAAVTWIRGQQSPRTIAATGPVPKAVDELQYATGEGPCLDATVRDDLAQVDDLRVDQRWPRFGPRCVAETGVHSMLSVRLTLGGQDRAAMNLYAERRAAFDDLEVSMASVLAPFAGLAVQAQLRDRDRENFETALSTSRQIGAAVGILMAREGLTSVQAFERLREASQRLNRRLREIAAEVEYTGNLPSFDPASHPPQSAPPASRRDGESGSRSESS